MILILFFVDFLLSLIFLNHNERILKLILKQRCELVGVLMDCIVFLDNLKNHK